MINTLTNPARLSVVATWRVRRKGGGERKKDKFYSITSDKGKDDDVKSKISKVEEGKKEKRQIQDDAVINVIHRYWNQLNEDVRILLQRFDAETGDESEKDNENESRNDVNWVGKVCQILELELAFVAYNECCTLVFFSSTCD